MHKIRVVYPDVRVQSRYVFYLPSDQSPTGNPLILFSHESWAQGYARACSILNSLVGVP